MMSWQQTGGLAAHLALGQQGQSKRALYYAAKHCKGRQPVGRPLWFQRAFHDDDKTAHRHVTEHMRDLGERLQHKDDFPDDDITAQDEPPVDSPPTQGESTATGPPGPDSEGQMNMDPEEWERIKEKNLNQSALSSQQTHRSMQALMQHHERQREIMTTREEESMNLFHQSSQMLKTKS